LEQNRARIAAQGLGLAAISYDSVAVLKTFADREHIGYTLLSDADSKVIRAYGIFNDTVPKDSFAYGIPNPGTYILDAHGVVVGKYFEDDYRVRDTAESILFRQFGIEPEPRSSVAAKHLKIAVEGGETPVRPDQRVTLAVDLQLPERMHVYAPGVTGGYIPISFRLTPSPAFQADPVTFPASKTLRLEVIHETVPVFMGRFRLLDTVTLAGPQQVQPLLDAQGNLPVEGDLRYQACDDHECYPPETVHLKWTLQVLAFDRTRAPESLRRKQ